ncbi:tRNA (guanosine(18)-2'-O)-methyltransferase TrmH [Parashewanella spongiae]|uniref:tRNA (guanosine(18)-2'-O)-methyltransferase n=1 Tax=Parashewanella spongiae TaxID=342950 RepID=A0A3A6TKM7_9GAMM|nr:tRNA (guanosine(18)-2'-O)-methyltransferase TrmH [Parashewanella spongiae]MCL1078632.1 tRNA (guanosine(18)-2'-O)-methyltransferase TrmH [Parashewanella spongiae]RJY12975.1 tRNA (guanosine(18)-2'-O)-methyltransferase TrmH [Parashewanella spongiae]
MTPERFSRITDMLNHRQPDLTLCLDKVHKSNNVSAIVRTADAVGIHQIHAVMPDRGMQVSGNTASGSQQWVQTVKHRNITQAIEHLKLKNMQIIVTNFSDKAVDFREVDYCQPSAIFLGCERDGVSAEAIALADKQITIPMIGMVQSLNVSVAAGAILYEAQRQRQLADMYGINKLPEAYCQKLLFEQGHPIYAKACRRKGLPYPKIDELGQIKANREWWALMRKPADDPGNIS